MRGAGETVARPWAAARSRIMFRVAAVVVVAVACGLLAAALATRDEVCEPSDPAAPLLGASGIYMFVLVLVVLVLGVLAVRGRRLPDGWWVLGLACAIAFVIVLVAANVMPDPLIVCPR